MENKKEGILKEFWSKLKNFWNNLGIDVEDYKFTDEGFQKEIDNRGMDEDYEALQANSAEKCAEKVLQPSAGRAGRLDLSNALINGEMVKELIARRNEIKAKANANAEAKARDDKEIG